MMKTTANNNSKSLLNSLLIAALMILVISSSFAQNTKYKSQNNIYVGIEGSFGARSFTTESNIPQLNNLTTVKAGGSIGLIVGTPVVKFPVSIGLYYQALQETRTIDLFTAQSGINVSLLRLLGVKKSPVDIYTLANVDFQSFTFMGTYVDLAEGQSRKEILGEQLLGRKSMVNGNVGLGIEVHLRDDFNFIHLFAETSKSYSLMSNATDLFNNTNITNNMAVNIGIRVGAIK